MKTRFDYDIRRMEEIESLKRRIQELETKEKKISDNRHFFSVADLSVGSTFYNPASFAIVENYVPVLQHDPNQIEESVATFTFPKGYNGGTVNMRMFAIQSGTNTGNVYMVLFIRSAANGEVFGAFSSKSTLIAMPGTDNTAIVTDWEQFASSPFDGDELVNLISRRVANDGLDTYPDDFQLCGVEIEWE